MEEPSAGAVPSSGTEAGILPVPPASPAAVPSIGAEAGQASLRFRFEDWGWVVIHIGMGIGAGIVMLPVEVGMKGFWVFLLASAIGYPGMYLFQRVFVNSLVEGRSCKDYAGILSDYLGKNWGAVLGFLYFVMLVIWYFVYSETVVKDSASYLHTFGVTSTNWSSHPLYVLALISLLTFIASKGERLLFKVSSVLALTVLAVLVAMGFAMIPAWSLRNLGAPPAGVLPLLEDAVVALPFVLTSILFLQSLSPMVIYFRQHTDSKQGARFRSLRAMNLAFAILFVVVFFYANSFNLSLTQEQAVNAFNENISALAIAAEGRPSLFLTVCSVLLDVFAVVCCFFAVFLGLREGTRGLVLNLLKRFGASARISEAWLDRILAVFLVLLATGNTMLDWKILYYTLLCSPIFGIVGCFLPVVLVCRVPELRTYRGPHLVFIVLVGVLLCLSPLLAFR